MTEQGSAFQISRHSHVFLGDDHERAERRTWAVIVLCTVMMIAEIVGGSLFGSLALIADGWHMSTHAGALLLAALAYSYARRHCPAHLLRGGHSPDAAGRNQFYGGCPDRHCRLDRQYRQRLDAERW